MAISSSFFVPREEQGYHSMYKRIRIMPLYSFPHYKDLSPHTEHAGRRVFIHLDFDAFYAQVEQRDNPNLRGKPVSVGSTTGMKGIVMTASYEARAFGIETGTSLWEAKKLCPQLISLPCYGPKYEIIMQNLMTALKRLVPEECIETYSIDEYFLDITDFVKNFDEAREFGRTVKKRIMDLENLTVSVGVSYNKTYAKMATKFQKPDGLTVIRPEDKETLMYPLPVKKIWGIGTRIGRRLGLMNILTVGDLANSNEGSLKKEFGVNGIVFRRLARGEDTSGIFRKERPEKMLNHHHTLTNNIFKPKDVRDEIRRVGEYLCRKMRAKELVAGHLYFVIRYGNLRYASNDMRLREYTNDDREIFEAAMKIYENLPDPREDMPARMFGMSVFDLHKDTKNYNFDLFRNRVHLPFYELDKLKQRYGEGIIRVGLNNN
ncbi:MAG: DNA polymerase IV [Ignavibacteria bacterium]|nr:DNA polymerase IV [Ignavibacteria bacterium]